MTVAASIVLAALVGGIIFVLLDSWQRRAATPTAPAPPEPPRAWQPPPSPEPVQPVEPRARTPWERPPWEHDDRWDDQDPPANLWSGWPRGLSQATAPAIASRWRWSVPQQPPSTLSRGSAPESPA